MFNKLRKIFSIKYKMMLLTFVVVFVSVVGLSLLVYVQFRRVILAKTTEVCRNLSANISDFAREELLLKEEDGVFERTRDSVQRVAAEGDVAGLINAYVVYRDGEIVAHTSRDRVGQQVGSDDQEKYRALEEIRNYEVMLDGREVLRFAAPISVKPFERPALRVGTGVFEFDKRVVYGPVEAMRSDIINYLLLLLVGTLILTFVLAQRMSKPIERLASAAGELKEGKLGVQVRIKTGGEIGQLATVFNDMSTNLKSAEEQRRDLERIKLQQAAVSRELEIARGIQLAVLPLDGTIGPYAFVGYMETADEVGGDYYDCIKVNGPAGEYYWFFVGDVSGHGLQSGLTMLMAQTAIQTTMELRPDLEPDEALVSINRVLYSNINRLREKKYMTASFYRADAKGNFMMAGLHQDVMLYRHKSRKVEVFASDGMWLGIEEEIREDISNQSFRLAKGDTLLLFTDGITEAVNSRSEMFTDERLAEALERYGDLPLDQIRNNLLDDLMAHIGETEKRDDITFALVRRES